MVCRGRRDQHHPMPFPEYCYCCLTLKCPLLPLAPQETTARVTQAGFLTNPVPPAPAVGTSDSCGEPSPSQDRGVLSNPCWLPPRPTPSPAGAPHVRVALKALLHKVVEVGREGAVVGVGGRVTVGGPGGAGGQALAQARVGCRARGAHGQLLGGDGAGIQQAGHRAVQLLQQHLGRTEPGPGWRGPRKDPRVPSQVHFSPNTRVIRGQQRQKWEKACHCLTLIFSTLYLDRHPHPPVQSTRAHPSVSLTFLKPASDAVTPVLRSL